MTIEKDSDVRDAIAHWAPRFIQNGVDHNDFVATTGRISSWSEWLPEWNRTAEMHVQIAMDAEQNNHYVTAGHAWRRASVTRHFGKFVWTVDLELAAEATLRAVDEMRRAHVHLDPSAERIETAFSEATVAATLRKPASDQPPPLVVLIPGLDSTKEEFFYFEQAYLDRGMATLSIDGPGQGETGLQLPISDTYEEVVSAVLDTIWDRTDVDLQRLGLCGVSLGGFYAPRIAAFEPRIRAVAGISGSFNFADLWDSLPPISMSAFMAKANVETPAEGREVAASLNLDSVCERIKVPALYVTGERDRLVPWQQTERIAKETPGGVFVCYPDGNHTVANLPHVARPMIADWLHDRLHELS